MSRLKAMAASALAVGGGPRLVDRPVVHGSCNREQSACVTFVDRVRLRRRQLDSVEPMRNDVVHQQPLHRVDDLVDVA